jgi:hypothetical protein
VCVSVVRAFCVPCACACVCAGSGSACLLCIFSLVDTSVVIDSHLGFLFVAKGDGVVLEFEFGFGVSVGKLGRVHSVRLL